MHIKTIVYSLLLLSLSSSPVIAAPLLCESEHAAAHASTFCADVLESNRLEMNEKYITAYLVTDAPARLIEDTHHAWLKRSQDCKSQKCILKSFEQRIDRLNVYTSMNQSLTQHYLQYKNGKLAEPAVHIQVHQLSKERIKIEGIAYRNINNRPESQSISLLAYSTPTQKSSIIDNENKCQYQMNFQRALLVIESKQKGCERFTGTYRLYD